MCPACQATDCWHVEAAYDQSPWAILDSLEGPPKPTPQPMAPWTLLSEWRQRRLLI